MMKIDENMRKRKCLKILCHNCDTQEFTQKHGVAIKICQILMLKILSNILNLKGHSFYLQPSCLIR